MAKVDWTLLARLHRDGQSRPPAEHRLTDLTAELTEMLGSPDPALRDELALELLTGWVAGGVYDDLLPGLGDGIATGLATGLGEDGTDSVFRRSRSALVLAEVIERDAENALVPDHQVLQWGDRLAAWFTAERDLRGFVPEKGWANAVAHGADAIGALARSPHLGRAELTVLLEVLGERAAARGTEVWSAGEADRLALATLSVLHRGVVPLDQIEAWTADLLDLARAEPPATMSGPGSPARANITAFLRALYLHLSLGRNQPPGRTDLLLIVIERLRAAQPGFFGRR